ncbi:MAG: hypothetical protein ACFB10_23005 [Salibacteraceae bacterium]
MFIRLMAMAALMMAGLTSHAQFGPGEDGALGGGGVTDPDPDLVLSSVTMPPSIPSGAVLTFPLVINNTPGSYAAPSTVRVQLEVGPFNFVYIDVPVPAFHVSAAQHTVWVSYQLDPTITVPGFTVSTTFVTLDVNNVVAETNEYNNLTVPSISGTVVF